MTDQEEISCLINEYSRKVDSGDLEGFAALFADGAWFLEGTQPNYGSQAITENVTSNLILYSDGTPRTRHVNTNVNIEVDAQHNRATCQRYVSILQQTDKLPLQVIASGDYFDEFAKTGGRWHFTKTEVRRPFLGDVSHHIKGDSFLEQT